MKAKEILDILDILNTEIKVAEQLIDYYSNRIIHLNKEIEQLLEQNLKQV